MWKNTGGSLSLKGSILLPQIYEGKHDHPTASTHPPLSHIFHSLYSSTAILIYLTGFIKTQGYFSTAVAIISIKFLHIHSNTASSEPKLITWAAQKHSLAFSAKVPQAAGVAVPAALASLNHRLKQSPQPTQGACAALLAVVQTHPWRAPIWGPFVSFPVLGLKFGL